MKSQIREEESVLPVPIDDSEGADQDAAANDD